MATATQEMQNVVNREEFQSAIAKTMELRALHNALLIHKNSPPNLKFPFSSPVSQFSAQDYPVFTPSYEEESLPKNHHKSRTLSESWSDFGINATNFKNQISPEKSELYKSSRRASSTNFKNHNSSEFKFPLTDSHFTLHPKPKSKGILSRFFPNLKKKQKKIESLFSTNRTESENVSQVFRNLGILSVETLKREISQANESKNAALMEVSETKSSIFELRKKLEHLEAYCEELRRALRQAKVSKDSIFRGEKGENRIPEEEMVEVFVKIVSESRLSVKKFCKTLFRQIDSKDSTVIDSLNSLLQRYKLSFSYSNYPKTVLYHLEAVINQTLYQDFENPGFRVNGSPFHLDPDQDRQANFALFFALRDLSWNEVVKKGTKYYSEEFSKFLDQKMSCVIKTLNWTRPWHEELLQVFFDAAKCVWLIHLLAFSFSSPLRIFRAEENRRFDSGYMEDMLSERGRLSGLGRVKVMVMPGFYVGDRVLKCKVLCRYKNLG